MWQFLSLELGVWRDIVYARYRVISTSSILGGRIVYLRPVSPRWRGVSLLGAKRENPLDWFRDDMVKKLGLVFELSYGKTRGLGIFLL